MKVAAGAGFTPHALVGELLNVFRTLRGGDAQAKAALIRNLLTSSLDEQTAQLLDLRVPPPSRPDPAEVQRLVDAGVRERLVADDRAAAVAVLREFASSGKAEFFNEVRTEFNAVVQAELGRQPRRLTAADLEKAYQTACKLHPKIGPIIAQREAAAAVPRKRAEMQKMKASTTSLRNEPPGPSRKSRSQTTADAAAEAYDELSDRRHV
jgi:hypothetical protein